MKIKRFFLESKELGFLSFLGFLIIVFLYFNLKYLRHHSPFSQQTHKKRQPPWMTPKIPQWLRFGGHLPSERTLAFTMMET
ncbi:hypothetical protein GHT06_015351 [Daphnia sinensis]|uniref:Uncharacterized protein n=1 Tax=Daphnia sinensis TaxID=1820382 RepID=A0AAD5LA96_9CRUS|nr:hypothetical protein GHT06_015351 [Daphnia sinensis]